MQRSESDATTDSPQAIDQQHAVGGFSLLDLERLVIGAEDNAILGTASKGQRLTLLQDGGQLFGGLQESDIVQIQQVLTERQGLEGGGDT